MSRRGLVASFDELLRPFAGGLNAKCFARRLEGDFEGVARAFAEEAEATEGILVLEATRLHRTPGLDPRAIAVVLDDLERLTALGREPQLNVITRYPRDERALPVKVDVHSFHADRAPVEADTFLCTYAGAPSEGLDNDAATRLVDDPELLAALRALHGRDDGFTEFLEEESFDLHFRPTPGAQPFSFEQHHLWRIAVAWPGSPVPPCLHRAPLPDGAPRLLLIA